MNTPIRTLTIENFNPHGRFRRSSTASLIRLKGCWLKQAGFHAGAQIKVINPSSGVIELRVSSVVQIDPAFFIAMNQLNAVLQ
jgi:hypothetical protein